MRDELVERARGGDRAAMEDLLASIAPSIRRFAQRMCRNDADADDVLQDALASIAAHLDTFEGRSSVPSWAFALTRSACARKRRGRKNEPAAGEEELGRKAADEPGPEEEAARRQMRSLVVGALERLPEAHREVLLLRDVEGLTAPEAAAALGLSVDALKSRLHRARAALRDELRPVLEPSRPSPGCPDVLAALSQKLEDELDDEACRAMEAHVSRCPACARTCDAMKDALLACRASPVPSLTPELRARVREAVTRWLATRRSPVAAR